MGVAYAGLLLEKALNAIMGPPLVILEALRRSRRCAVRAARARFALNLLLAQLFIRRRWWMFNHVGHRAGTTTHPAIRSPTLCGAHVRHRSVGSKPHPESQTALCHATARIAISRYTALRCGDAASRDRQPIVACPLALLPSAAMAVTFDHPVLDPSPRGQCVGGRPHERRRAVQGTRRASADAGTPSSERYPTLSSWWQDRATILLVFARRLPHLG